MLDRTDRKLQSYFDNQPQIGANGQLFEMDRVTKINRRQCDRMAELHLKAKPDLSIETGLAYGFSSISMLDAMEVHGYGHHIAIDPAQATYWHGIALAAIDELGFSNRFSWIEARSDQAFLELIQKEKRAQFIFFDGVHTFDGILADFCLADQLLDVGGLLVVNDMWLPAVRSIASFLVNNMTNYTHSPIDHENIFVLQKTRKDERDWNHFVPFDGSGAQNEGNEKKKGFLQRMLAG